MTFFPIGTIGLLFVGILGIVSLALTPRTQPYTRYVALIAVGLVFPLLLVSHWVGEPTEVVISLWQPSLLFGTVLTLQPFIPLQPLAWALAMATFSAIVVYDAETAKPRFYITALTLLAMGLVSFWSDNILTLIISWMIYDLICAMGCAHTGGSVRGAMRRLVVGSLSTVCLWTGALLSYGEALEAPWSLMTIGDTTMLFWMMTGVLRFWIYPFHLSVPFDWPSAGPLAPVLLLTPALGWGLWIRLVAVNGGLVPGGDTLSTLAAITIALGGVLAWTCGSARRALPWIGMGTAAATLLTATLAGERAMGILAAGGVAWVLGLSMLSLGPDGSSRQPAQRWWGGIPALVGGVAVLGLPLTPGLMVGANLIDRFTGRSDVWKSIEFWGTFLGYLLLVPALVRYLALLVKGTDKPAGEPATETPLETSTDSESVESSVSSDPNSPPEESTPNILRTIRQRWNVVIHTLYRGGIVVKRALDRSSWAVGLGLPTLLLIATGLFPAWLEGGHPSAMLDGQFPSLISLLALPGLLGWGLWIISLGLGGLLAWQDENLRPRLRLVFDALNDFLRLEWLYEAVIGALGRGLSLLRWADEVVGGAGALLWTWLLFLLVLLVRGIE